MKEGEKHFIIADKFSLGMFHKRNDFLIGNSSVVIYYYDGQPGGTHYTVELAERKQLEIINLYQKAYPAIK